MVHCIRTIITRRRSWLLRKKNIIPDYESVTPFLKGQASKIFKEVADSDKVLIIQKQNKPQKEYHKIDKPISANDFFMGLM